MWHRMYPGKEASKSHFVLWRWQWGNGGTQVVWRDLLQLSILIVTAASPGLVKLNNKAAKNLRRSRATSRGLPKKGQWWNSGLLVLWIFCDPLPTNFCLVQLKGTMYWVKPQQNCGAVLIKFQQVNKQVKHEYFNSCGDTFQDFTQMCWMESQMWPFGPWGLWYKPDLNMFPFHGVPLSFTSKHY